VWTDDAGNGTERLSVFRGGQGPEVVLADSITGFILDPAQTKAFVGLPSGFDQLVDIATGAMTFVDNGVRQAFFDPTGTTLFYSDFKRELKRTPVAAPAPVVLVASQVDEVVAISPDSTHVVTLHAVATDAGQDLVYSVSRADVPSQPVELFTFIGGGSGGDYFTADSTHVVVSGQVTNTLSLLSSALDGTSMQTLSTDQGVRFVSTTGPYTLFFDYGQSELVYADTTDGTKSVVTSTQSGNFLLTPDRQTIVYSNELGVAFGHLLTVPLPAHP
jgi:hypothetical protein